MKCSGSPNLIKMQTFQKLADKLLNQGGSKELHNVANTLVGIANIYNEIEGCGAELYGTYTLRLTVSLDCLREIQRPCEETINHPSKGLPYYWLRVEEGMFRVDFQTEKVDLYFKEQENFKPLTH